MGTVVVTGGVGRIGRWTIDALLDEGWDVVCVDVDAPESPGRWGDGVSFCTVELTEQGETWEVLFDVDPDAVVHLAGIPVPGGHAGTRVFDNNVYSTYNVCTGAGRVGADVVFASSKVVHGYVMQGGAYDPPSAEYLPIDEAHPQYHSEPYSTSKVVGEEIGKLVARKHGVSVSSLRFSAVQHPGQYHILGARDAPERAAGVLWSYIDVRDVASMIAATLHADLAGHEAFLVVAPETVMDEPTTDLYEEYVGPLPEECSIAGEEAAYSAEKARRQVGWTAEHDYHTAASEKIPLPFTESGE